MAGAIYRRQQSLSPYGTTRGHPALNQAHAACALSTAAPLSLRPRALCAFLKPATRLFITFRRRTSSCACCDHRPGAAAFASSRGVAAYWSLDLAGTVADVAWSYGNPSPAYAALRDYLAFYATRVDECTIDGERVQPQPGDFYGGWITSHVAGPFKGAPGTLGW